MKSIKKNYSISNYIEHQLILIFLVSRCVSITVSALAGIHIVIASSAIELKICVITAGTKEYKSIINKEKKKHDKMYCQHNLN